LPAAQPFDPGGDIIGVLGLWRVELAAQAKTAASGAIGLGNRRRAVDQLPAGGEIGAVEQFHQPCVFHVGIVDQFQRRVDHFCNIVAGNAGRHADRDPA